MHLCGQNKSQVGLLLMPAFGTEVGGGCPCHHEPGVLWAALCCLFRQQFSEPFPLAADPVLPGSHGQNSHQDFRLPGRVSDSLLRPGKGGHYVDGSEDLKNQSAPGCPAEGVQMVGRTTSQLLSLHYSQLAIP